MTRSTAVFRTRYEVKVSNFEVDPPKGSRSRPRKWQAKGRAQPTPSGSTPTSSKPTGTSSATSHGRTILCLRAVDPTPTNQATSTMSVLGAEWPTLVSPTVQHAASRPERSSMVLELERATDIKATVDSQDQQSASVSQGSSTVLQTAVEPKETKDREEAANALLAIKERVATKLVAERPAPNTQQFGNSSSQKSRMMSYWIMLGWLALKIDALPDWTLNQLFKAAAKLHRVERSRCTFYDSDMSIIDEDGETPISRIGLENNDTLVMKYGRQPIIGPSVSTSEQFSVRIRVSKGRALNIIVHMSPISTLQEAIGDNFSRLTNKRCNITD